jgi:cellobiose-specific phosphotransferase system component IIA
LIQQALTAMKRNQFEDAEDLLRSAKGELHDSNMNMPHMGSGMSMQSTRFNIISSQKKMKFYKNT